MTTHEVVLPMFSPAAQQPTKRYRTIVADPPWRIEMGRIYPRQAEKAKLEYPTLTQAELLNMPVGLWACEKSHLYLWTPNSMVPNAYELAKSWGFRPSCLITWIKRRPNGDESIGLGHYYRITTEHILFAVRGGLDVKRADQPNLFYAPRHAHSEKPAAFYDMVERMSPGPYLDVFARKQRFGWDTWGNEAFDFRTDGIWNNENG